MLNAIDKAILYYLRKQGPSTIQNTVFCINKKFNLNLNVLDISKNFDSSYEE